MSDAEPIRFLDENLPYFELSNFSPHGFEADGVCWPTVEHYFQAQKFGDPAYRETIRQALSPSRAKELGQSREVPLRPDWAHVKEDVMRRALRLKFAASELRELLLATGDRPLIEASRGDGYWGEGRDGKGRNRAGVLLMELRDRLRAADTECS